MARWERREIDPEEVIIVIREYGAPTTGELKSVLKTDSTSLLKALGALLMVHRVFVMGAFNGVVWMEVTGKRGRPNVKRARKEAGKDDPNSPMRDVMDPRLVRREHGHGTPMQEGGGKAIREGRAVRLASDIEGKTETSESVISHKRWGLLNGKLEAEEISYKKYLAACKRYRIDPDTGDPV